MDITCPNCGTSNRSTSRFCARCGEALPRHEETAQKGEGALDLPWLQAVQDHATKPTGHLREQQAGQVESAPSQTPAGAGGDEVAPRAESHPEQTATPAEAQQPVETQAAPTGEAPPTEAVTPQETGAPDEAPPEWVVSILEPAAAPPPPTETYEGEELAHMMPWAYSEPENAESAAAPTGTPGLPPWLGDITVQETLQSSAPGAEQPVLASGASPELDLEGIEPFVPPEIQEQTTSPQLAQAAKSSEKLPEWLKSLPAEKQKPGLDRITPVTKVILQPEDTLGQPVMREVPVRPPRPGAVETLAALVQTPTSGAAQRALTVMALEPGMTEELEREARRVRPMRWLLPDGIIYVAILAALVFVLIVEPPFGDVNAPAAPGVLQFYNTIQQAPTDKPVLVVYDWDASRSAEMTLLSQAIMHHLMSRHLRFVTVSTVPQGPGFAQQITSAITNDPKTNYGYEYGRDYLILGYLPGNEAALKALVSDFGTALPLDYINNQRIDASPFMQAAKVRGVGDFALIIDLASDESELRNWIEQVASRTNVPLLAAVPQGLEPLARPYENVQGAGLKTVVSGPAGALQYTQELARRGVNAQNNMAGVTTTRLNAQSVAQLLVALVIVVAIVSMGTRRIFRR